MKYGYIATNFGYCGDARTLVVYVREHRTSDGPYDVCTFGMTSGPDDTSTVAACAEVDATWWHDFSVPWLISLDEVRARLRKGPPRL
jgi:hypothetical protein